MRAPAFWTTDGWASRALTPASRLYRFAAGWRAGHRIPYIAPVPVLCVGNAVAGGAGKTPVVRFLLARLQTMAARPHALSRGYGGRLPGPLRVDPACHTAREVGDEPLLLARQAPAWIARDRPAGLRLAAHEAGIVVMDDGLQNPTVAKQGVLLVVDGGYGIGNGRVLPAGPLREPWPAALARADAVVLIGEDRHGMAARCGGRPVLRARLEPQLQGLALTAQPWLAFAGIGRPQKFYDTLREAGAVLAECCDFPDHHPYRPQELEQLAARAAARQARLITTEKDAVRLPAAWRERIDVLPVALRFEASAEVWLDAWLDSFLAPKAG